MIYFFLIFLVIAVFVLASEVETLKNKVYDEESEFSEEPEIELNFKEKLRQFWENAKHTWIQSYKEND